MTDAAQVDLAAEHNPSSVGQPDVARIGAERRKRRLIGGRANVAGDQLLSPGGYLAEPWVGLAVIFAVFLVAPFIVSDYTVTNLTEAMAFGMLCLSLQLLFGWTGILSLGQAGIFGVAAYASGLVAIHYTADVLILVAVGVVAGAVAAGLSSILLVRSSGGYLLMITIAIGEILASAAKTWKGLTGGDNGLAGVPHVTIAGWRLGNVRAVYWFAFAVLAACVFALYAVSASPLGRTLRGIRDNEPRMQSIGYRTYWYKFAAIVASGAVAGLAGVVWIADTRYVSPGDLTIGKSSMVFIAVALGGTARLWGPLVGALAVILIQNRLPSSLEGRDALVLGGVLMLVVYVMPGGLTTIPRRMRRRSDSEGGK